MLKLFVQIMLLYGTALAAVDFASVLDAARKDSQWMQDARRSVLYYYEY